MRVKKPCGCELNETCNVCSKLDNLLARRWVRLWPGMQDEVVMLTDDEVITALGSQDEQSERLAIRYAKPCDWVCDADGYYIRLSNGPLFGNYFIPR